MSPKPSQLENTPLGTAPITAFLPTWNVTPSGPPSLIKPSHEFMGEILLSAGRPKEAAEQFGVALLRQPNRARSLLGIARANAKSGDTKAAVEAYSKLVRQWNQADPELPELREAQDYLKQARVN